MSVVQRIARKGCVYLRRHLKNLNIKYEYPKLIPLLEQVLMGVVDGEKVTVGRRQTSGIVGYSTMRVEIGFKSKSFEGKGDVWVRRLTENMWRLDEIDLKWFISSRKEKVIFT